VIDAYVAAFVARSTVRRHPGRKEIGQPGVHGLLPSGEDPFLRLLVTDDRAYDAVAKILPEAAGGIVNVLDAAPRCAELFDRDGGWMPKPVTAMVCADLNDIPVAPLPAGLALRPVRRRQEDPPDGVPLEAAVGLALRADPAMDDPPEAFAGYLRSMPPSVLLFAAVAADGAVRATCGAGVFGAYASVVFVNTDPDWRGRGIGRAMTAAALRAASDAGATQACLDASDVAVSIYRRLGFATVGAATQYFRRG
jgi:ribosomal protein S18 acetylase RimI-like enzyme